MVCKLCFFVFLFFGCVGSLLLSTGFLQLWRAGATIRCGAQASHCGGFSCCGARALGAWASVVVAHGLSSCGSRALERRLSSCGTWAQLLHGMWDLPGPGFELVSPALAGGFLTTAPPGKSPLTLLDAETILPSIYEQQVAPSLILIFRVHNSCRKVQISLQKFIMVGNEPDGFCRFPVILLNNKLCLKATMSNIQAFGGGGNRECLLMRMEFLSTMMKMF